VNIGAYMMLAAGVFGLAALVLAAIIMRKSACRRCYRCGAMEEISTDMGTSDGMNYVVSSVPWICRDCARDLQDGV